MMPSAARKFRPHATIASQILTDPLHSSTAAIHADTEDPVCAELSQSVSAIHSMHTEIALFPSLESL
jgi:hypothetical protein